MLLLRRREDELPGPPTKDAEAAEGDGDDDGMGDGDGDGDVEGLLRGGIVIDRDGEAAAAAREICKSQMMISKE